MGRILTSGGGPEQENPPTPPELKTLSRQDAHHSRNQERLVVTLPYYEQGWGYQTGIDYDFDVWVTKFGGGYTVASITPVSELPPIGTNAFRTIRKQIWWQIQVILERPVRAIGPGVMLLEMNKRGQ